MMKDYFILHLQIILSLLCLPFVFRVIEKGAHSYRYGVMALAFLAAYSMLQISVLFFLSLGCLIFYSIESLFGKIGLLPLLFLLLLSPVVYYLSNVFTFSIRLAICDHAANFLSIAGLQVRNHGSYFEMADGSRFRVDKECMGLNMISTGLCITVLLIAFRENKIKRYLSILPIGILTLISFSLLILTNLLRIVGLVLFKSPPESFSHDVIGLFSLLVYMVVPMYFLVNIFVEKLGKEQGVNRKVSLPYGKRLSILSMLSIVIFFTGNYVMDLRKENVRDEKLNSLNLQGYNRCTKDDQVMEFRSNNALIYIKPAVRGYESDHLPSMCWQGNGFELCSFKQEYIGEFSIMTGQLKKGNVIQYTAWWYDNGIDKTVDQWEWRFSKGEPYRIINITAQSSEQLELLYKEFLKRKLF
jgi:exosortase N